MLDLKPQRLSLFESLTGKSLKRKATDFESPPAKKVNASDNVERLVDFLATGTSLAATPVKKPESVGPNSSEPKASLTPQTPTKASVAKSPSPSKPASPAGAESSGTPLNSLLQAWG